MTTLSPEPKIRVLQIVKGLDIGSIHGGAERFGADLANELKNIGCQVRLAAFFKTGTSREESTRKRLEDAGVEVFFGPEWAGNNQFGAYLKGVSSLSRYLEGKPVDIVHSHFQLGSLTAIYLKLTGRARKAVRTAHLATEWEKGWYGRLRRTLVAGWVYPLALDAEVGVSQAIVDDLQHNPGMVFSRHLRPVKIFNALPVSPDQFRPRGERNITTPVIGTVARLEEQKGIRYLLQAAPAVLERFPGAQFWIIGQGSLREELEATSRQAGTAEAVKFLGQRTDVIELVQQMDLFVSPSLWEGLPTVVLESMACGTPVIATDIPGTREIIQSGMNGWLVLPGDPAALAGAILRGLEFPSEMARLASQAHAQLEQFSMPVIAAQYLKLYQSLLED